jgi:hypothetical protein
VDRALPALPHPSLDAASPAMSLPAADVLDEAGKTLARLLKFMFFVEKDKVPTVSGASGNARTAGGTQSGRVSMTASLDSDPEWGNGDSWLLNDSTSTAATGSGYKVAEMLSPWGLSTQNPKVPGLWIYPADSIIPAPLLSAFLFVAFY